MAVDEFAWRVRMARRRKAISAKIPSGSGIHRPHHCCACSYLGYYIQRPAYALEQAAAAVRENDAELFSAAREHRGGL